MSIPESLQLYFENKGISQVDIANRLGVTKTYVNALLTGRKTFGKKQAEIWSNLFGLSKSWLLTGEGSMLNSDPRNEVEDITEEEANTIAEGLRTGKLKAIPLIPASAFAGGIKGFAPEGIDLAQCERIASPIDGAEMAIPITGDSMEPDYPNGAIAYIKRINEVAFIPWGHTVILDTENGAFIKRIYPDDTDVEYVWGKSINPAYPPMHIPKSSIFRIFRVLGTTRIFTTM